MATSTSRRRSRATPDVPATKRPAASDAARRLDHEHVALVLQGGGALGAYQAGVFEELTGCVPREPTWVAGVSIGAINAALIVGNPPEKRVERLREFWTQVSSGTGTLAAWWDGQRSALHQYNALVAATFGVPGFYSPRVPPPMLQPDGTPAALSWYDTQPLAATLERLVDFDRINDGPIRLSVGAVNVLTGNSEYFDNRDPGRRIGVEHILASGALPPAFPPVVIDDQPYWDGGIVSNTPIQYVLDTHDRGKKLMIAQVDLFSARGSMPMNMAGVMSRHKDIVYSSRTRYNTDRLAEIQRNRKTILQLIAMMGDANRDKPEVRALAASCRTAHIDIVHLIYRQSRFELESKDYEFSAAAVAEHWSAGRADMAATIDHPDWLRRRQVDDGITIYDLAHERPRGAGR